MHGHNVSISRIISSLIQANLGCLPVQEFGLNQDTQVHMLYSEYICYLILTFQLCRKYFEVLHVCQNVSHPLFIVGNHYSVNAFTVGLMELEMLSDNFECLLNAVLLNKCFHAKYIP